MPLITRPYNESSGEWFPFNGTNYNDRARAMYFFRSLNNGNILGSSDIQFKTSQTLFADPNSGINSWPITTQTNIDDTGADGVNMPPIPVFQLTYNSNPNDSNIEIKINKPKTLDSYELFYGTGNEEAAANRHRINTDVYESYKDEILKILDYNAKTDTWSLQPNIEGFEWGNIAGIDCSNVTSTIETLDNIQESPSVFPILNGHLSITLKLSNNVDFPDQLYQGNVVWSRDSLDDGVIDFNTILSPETISGNIIYLDNFISNQIFPPMYIELSDNLGRYYVNERYTANDGGGVLLVDRLDGLPFQTGNHTGITVTDISYRPRLRVRYRVSDTPTQPRVFYKLYGDNDDTNLSWGSSNHNNNVYRAAENEYSIIVDDSSAGANDRIFRAGLINYNDSVNGAFPMCLQTTRDTGTGYRLSPWRKAYRFLSRFRPHTVDLTWQNNTEGPSTYRFSISPTLISQTAIDFADNNEPIDSSIRPDAIPHRPPCYSPKINNRQGLIVLTNSASPVQQIDGIDWPWLSSGQPTIRWPGTNGGNYYIRSAYSGYVFQEGATPNSISFKANMNDARTDGSLDYDYTGLVSCQNTVIPAYSGEILYFDTDHGFMRNNYTNPDVGITDKTVVFIDITETDEVLRWNGSNYNPSDAWRATFNSMTVVINDITVATFNNHAVLLNNKDNYVVAMWSDDTLPTISDNDEIKIHFHDKQVIQDWQSNNEPASSTYGPIAYRDLAEEHIDDIRNAFVESALRDFTITSDGTVDGTITINYDGDVPEGTEFRLYIQDDDTTP